MNILKLSLVFSTLLGLTIAANNTVAGEIKLSDLPKVVASGFSNDHPKTTITSVIKEMHFGMTLYEIKFQTAGKHEQALYDDKGKHFGHEVPLALELLPQTVKNSLLSEFPTMKILDAEQITHPDGRIEYEIELTSQGVEWELALNPEGKILVKEKL